MKTGTNKRNIAQQFYFYCLTIFSFFCVSLSAQPTTINLEEVKNGGSASSLSVSTSAALTAIDNDFYIAIISSKSKKDVVSVNGLGLTWIERIDQCAGRNQTGIEIWTAQGIPSGNEVVTALFDNTPSNAVIAVARYSGVDPLNAIGNFTSFNTNGEGASCSGGVDNRDYTYNISTTLSNSLIFSAAAHRNRNHAAGAGYTEQGEFLQGSGGSAAALSFMDKSVALPSTETVDGTFSGSVDWATGTLVIQGGSGVPQYNLSSLTAPSSGGSVSRTPDKSFYDENESVDLTATPATGFLFDSWSGDIAGATATNPAITLTMDQNRTVTANFTPIQRTLSTAVTPGSSGSIGLSPDKPTYDHGETVDLTASPGSTYEFTGWSGDIGSANPTSNPLSLTMDQDRNVTANFQPKPEYVSASVTPSDDTPLTGNNITATIALDMNEANGATLGSLNSTLQWDPTVLSYSGNGGLLNGISGSIDESNNGSGQLSFSGAHGSGIGGVINIIEVNFTVIGAANDLSVLDLSLSSLTSFTGTDWLPTLTVADSSITVSGRSLNTAAAPVDGGDVSRSPEKSFYNNGENVSLSASPATGYLFVNWSGDIGGADANSPAIDVTMSQDRTVTANFAPIQRTLSSNVSPVGTGSITASPDKAAYDHGESVSVTANAGAGFRFSHWSGDIGGANASATTISLTTDQDRNITANFIEGPTEITYEGTTTGGSSDQFFVETATPVSAYNDQLYLVAISSKPYKTISGVSGMGLIWERVDLQCSGRSHNMVDIWMAIGNPGGDGIVRADFDDDPNHAVIAVSRYSGVDSANPIGNDASANANGLDGGCSGGSDTRDFSFIFNTSVDGATIYNITSLRNKTFTPGAGYSEHFELSQGSGSDIVNIALQEKKAEFSGAQTVNGFFNGKVDWSSVALEILPAGSSGPPRYSLNTAVIPSAGGSVSKTPNLSSYEENSLVALSATPAANYEFANWSGDIGGANPTDLAINVTMSQSRTITANFTPVQRFLSNTVSPDGSGSIVAAPAKSSYDHGESVSLTATAADNFEFVHWSGDIGGANPTANPLPLTMDQDRSVIANFQPLPEYVYARVVPDNDSALTGTTVTAQINIDMSSTNSELGNFSGSLSWDESVLSYSANGGLLNNFSGTVDVAGVAGGDLNFTASHPTGIAGDVAVLQITFDVVAAAGSASTLDLDFSALQSRTALDLLPTLTITDSSVTVIGYQLTTNSTPESGGTVQASPDKAVYNNGELVTLTASAAEHHLFSHWQGDIGDEDPAATSISVSMDSDKNIAAVFSAVQRTLTISTAPDGAGDVTRSPEKATYDHGELVTLTATPASGFQFASWSGDIGSADPNSRTINLTMDQDRSVSAGFSVGSAEVVYEGSTTGGSSGAFFVETSTPVTAVVNNLYLAAISSKPSKTINNVSGMGLTWERVDVQCSGRSHNMVEIWRAIGVPSGNGIVRADFDDDPNHAVIAVSRYSGVDDVTPIGAVVPVNSNGIDGACSGGEDGRGYTYSLTTGIDGAVIYAVTSLRNKTHTPGAGYTEHLELSQGSSSDIVNFAIQEKTVETAGTETVDGSFSGQVDWSSIALEIMPGGSSGPRQFSLTTTVNPAGSGSISRSITKPTYDEGEQVTLTATANAGFQFLNWTGDIGSANPNDNPIDISMSQHRTITANFEVIPGMVSRIIPSDATPFPSDDITTTIHMDITPIADQLGSFSGSLNWDPAVLAYISNNGLLQGFTGNIDVSNTANGEIIFSGSKSGGVGNSFDLLEIDFSVAGDANSGTVLDLSYSELTSAGAGNLLNEAIIRDSSISVSGYALLANVDDPAKGSISLSPDKSSYNPGETVALTAYANTNYAFSHWSGDIGNANNEDNPLSLVMDADRNIQAHFISTIIGNTPVNYTVAFFGDQGINNNAVAVMNMIKDEGADMIMHAGDLDYIGEPDEWVAQIAQVFPNNFPYFAVFGDKEEGSLTGSGSYQEVCETRMNLIGVPWDGSLGIQSSFTFNGIFFVLTAPGVSGSNHDTYIRNQLAANNDIWRVSVWHKNMRDLSPGLIGSSIGWDIYREARQAGVFIITGDDHIYGRSHLLSSMENQVIASTSDTLILVKDDPATAEDEGRSFVAVSGLGGRGINDQRNFDPLWASVYSRSQSARPGALFGVFNYNGQADLARFYFKDIDGIIADSFYVRSTTQTPPLAKQSQNTTAPAKTYLAAEQAFFNTYTAVANEEPEKSFSPGKGQSNTFAGKEIGANQGNTSQSNFNQTYLWKFSVDSIPGDITRATLRLYATATDTLFPNIRLHHISNTLADGENWIGKRINQQSLPAVIAENISLAGSVHNERWLEFDLSKLVRKSGEYSLMLESASPLGQLFQLGDAKNAPQLLVRLTNGKGHSNALPLAHNSNPAAVDSSKMAGENSPTLQTVVLPEKFALLGNYPNPFNMETIIRYALPRDATVRITVFNILGQPVNTLVNEYQSAGFHNTNWNGFSANGQPVSSGIYFVVMAVGKHRFVQKMMLQK